MTQKLNQIIVLFICLCSNGYVFTQNQTPNKSSINTLLWPYSLPATKDYGPMDVTVHGTYYFVRERFAGRYIVSLKYNITKIVYNPKYGSHRFKYKGQVYRQDEMNGVDGLGSQGFSQLKITGINIKMTVLGVKNGREFNIDSGFTHADEIGDISEKTDLNHLTLNLVPSYATNISYENSSELIYRINNMNKLIVDRNKYKTTILQADEAFNSKDWTKAKSLYESSTKLLPNEKHPKDQLKIIKNKEEERLAKEKADAERQKQTQTQTTQNNAQNLGGNSNGSSYNETNNNTDGITIPSSNQPELSDKVMVTNYGYVQVYKQNNKYYMLKADGSTHETTWEAYNNIISVANKNKKIRATNEQNKIQQQIDQQKEIDRVNAINQAKNDEVQRQTEQFNKNIDQIATSFYAMQSINDKKSAVEMNMSLNGNYKSIEELEQDFADKYNSLQQSLDELHKEEQNQNINNMNYYSTVGGDAGTAGTVAAGSLYFLNELQNQKEKENALKELERQKTEAQNQIIKAKIASRNALRQELFAMFPEGGIPLSKHKINVSEIYFFLYSFDESTIQTTNPTIQLSNVFPLAKYSDETWPFRSTLNIEIDKLNLSGTKVLVGYYTSRKMADNMRNSFIKLAGMSEMSITEIRIKGKPSANTSLTNTNKPVETNFWGEPVERNTNNQNNVDYWGNPIKE